MSERYQCYVIEYRGGYYSALEGRIRHITDAQLFSHEATAQEQVDELDSDSCVIKPVWIEWETDRCKQQEFYDNWVKPVMHLMPPGIEINEDTLIKYGITI